MQENFYTQFQNKRSTKIIFCLIYLIIMGVMCRYIKKNSYYDLDVVLYTACAIETNSSSIEEIHKQAY